MRVGVGVYQCIRVNVIELQSLGCANKGREKEKECVGVCVCV